MNLIPDVKDSEKTQIRSRARRFALDLLDASLGEGLELYNEVIEDAVLDNKTEEYKGGLYKRSARWKICLKCGIIADKEELKEETHKCASGFGKLPVIIPTSWIVLKDFFLTNRYVQALQKLGVEPIPARKAPIRVPIEEEAEIVAEEPAEVPDTVN